MFQEKGEFLHATVETSWNRKKRSRKSDLQEAERSVGLSFIVMQSCKVSS